MTIKGIEHRIDVDLALFADTPGVVFAECFVVEVEEYLAKVAAFQAAHPDR